MGFERDFKRFIYTASRFVITRFLFWEALSTAMLLGEWDGKNRSHGIPDLVIYVHIVVAFILASLMSFDENKRRHSAQLATIQMAFVTLASLMLWSNSGEAVRLKIFSRNIGVIAAFLYTSNGFTTSNRTHAQLANIFIGACMIIEAYLLHAWSAERGRLFDVLPFALHKYEELLTFTLCILLALSAFCFISGAMMRPGSKLALAIWILVIMINLNYKFWSGYMELWTHFRILASDICFGLILAVNYAIRD